jgi:hypothetical protein
VAAVAVQFGPFSNQDSISNTLINRTESLEHFELLGAVVVEVCIVGEVKEGKREDAGSLCS